MKHTVRILCIVLMAILVCVGLAACAHKEAEDHTATGDWLSDETHHWHACEKEKCEDAGDKAEHVYDNACDADCNTCGYKRTPAAHAYSNACDASCNICDATRTPAEHAYDNACDTACNVCGATRTITHAHGTTLTAGDTTHYYLCSVCGDKKDEAAHVFDKTVASSEYLKAAATATTKAQYWKSCVCGKASTTEYFETDKTAGTLANIQDLSKTYDKVALANPTYETNSDGAVTVEWYQGNTKLPAAPVNAGTYKVKVIIAESVTYAGVSAEKEFTIAKKVLSNMKASVAYDGSTTFGEMTLAHDGIVSGDVIIADIDVTNKNAGVYTGTNAMFSILDALGHGAANYEIDAQTTEVTVTPKALNLLDIKFTYDGGNIASRFDLTAADGVIAGDDVFLYGDGWQSYDVAYDEYTLTDDLGSYDYDEGVTLFGADKGNYKFTYDTDGSVGKVTVMPYILDFTGEYVKDADGTHYFTFTQDVTWSQGGTQTVTVKIALLDKEGNWITAPGVYTQENAQIADESFYIGSYKCEGFELDEDYYADEFKVTVLSTDDLILLATDRFNVGSDYIILVKVMQGTVKRGDSIVLPGDTDKVYEVLAIEKDRDFPEYATEGDEVGLYVDGMAALTEVTALSFLYENGNIPEMATEFLAKLYLKTQAEGGRQTPAFNGYKPLLRGLGVPQQGTITIISHYAKEDAAFWTPGETVLAKITLTTPVPAALLHGFEFTMAEDDLVTVTGVVVDGFIGSEQAGNSMLLTGAFNTQALTPVVFKITNTRTTALDTLELFVSTGNGGGNYLTDFTIELYDEDFNQIAGTHNNTEGTFTKDDSTKWSLAAGETCYVVVKTTNATDGVFVRLM